MRLSSIVGVVDRQSSTMVSRLAYLFDPPYSIMRGVYPDSLPCDLNLVKYDKCESLFVCLRRFHASTGCVIGVKDRVMVYFVSDDGVVAALVGWTRP
ncbi:hypothetical protein EVAR_54071_1 [Eumeta japonica]|uniref:Uncharacterized protein n=1 Tax=Eumeta variegata TaxID=151549 RepID=A0A4C1XDV3_EUMVA|nr:hypothetical protein EVAR_54071_1 [Eumeta japonica]